jgi:putative addiction module component (TIGR02574 family)
MFADRRDAVAIYWLFTSVEQAMASSIEVLEAEALQLPAADRARLVERLIASLDIDPAIEEAWATEVERRNAEIESGAVSLIPGPEALAELKAQFR